MIIPENPVLLNQNFKMIIIIIVSITYAVEAEGRISISLKTGTVLSTATLQVWVSQPFVEFFNVLCTLNEKEKQW